MEDTSEKSTKTLILDNEPLESNESDCDHSRKYESFRCPKIYINGQKYVVITHCLVEVFSVRFIDHSNRYISGNMRIQLENGNYYLFGAGKGDSCTSSSCIEVDSQGFAILMPDSDCPLDVLQILVFYPYLEKLKGKEEGLRALGRKKKKRMNIPFWDNRYEQRGQFFYDDFRGPSDELICKQLQTQAGPVEIAFAVFADAVEALVDVTIYNWRVDKREEPIKLYGIVTAKSSVIRKSQAKSILFQREKARNQYFSVDLSNGSVGDTALPLSRRKVVLPRNATLKVYIDIWRCFSDDTEDRRIARGKVEFQTKPSRFSDRVIWTDDFRVIQAEYFDIQVNVKWMHDTLMREWDDSSEEDDT